MYRSAAAALALALLGGNSALADSGPYLQVFGGPNFLPPGLEFESDAGNIEPDYENGYNVGGALGYRINEFFRIEGEVGYQRHDVARGDTTGLAQLISDIDGSAEILSGMLNAYVEGYFGFPLRPFLGIGGGVARVSLNNVGLALASSAIPGVAPGTVEANDIVDDEDEVTAAQLILGLGYDVTPHLKAAIGYRVFVGFDAEFETAEIAGVLDAERFGGDFYSHGARAELRYQF